MTKSAERPTRPKVMRRPRRVRVSAVLSAGGGGGPAELVSAAAPSRSPMSEPPDALDLSTQRLLPVCVIGTMASRLEGNATGMKDACKLLQRAGSASSGATPRVAPSRAADRLRGGLGRCGRCWWGCCRRVKGVSGGASSPSGVHTPRQLKASPPASYCKPRNAPLRTAYALALWRRWLSAQAWAVASRP
jgi:hypothetical protein